MFEDTTQSLIEQEQTLEQLKDNWAGYGEQLLSYVEEEQSKELDKIKKLSDAINNSLKDLLDKVKEDLDRRRQREDNAKTEQNLAKKQQQLAALRANTAGGNQVEIARLQEEITQGQQDYQRTLEDQLLERLNKQADEASKQREKQITLQENILQATNNAALVNEWMDDPKQYKDAIRQAFYSQAEYDKLTEAQQEQVRRKFDEMYLGLLTNKDSRVATEQSIGETQEILRMIRDSIQNMNKNNEDGDEGEPDEGGGDEGGEGVKPETPPTDNTPKETKQDPKEKYKETLKTLAKKGSKITYKDIHTTLAKAGDALGYTTAKTLSDLANQAGITWKDILKALQKDYNKYRLALTFANEKNFPQQYDAVYGKGAFETNLAYAKKNKVKKYAKGGLVDATGLAWLDGTKTSPEMVLSARDTENFIALRNALSQMLAQGGGKGGDNYFNIEINVDELANDYDVDQLADRIKKQIYDDSSYRNVNAISYLR
jgi:hypothetical protein